MGVSVDVSQVERFAADLGDLDHRLVPEVQKVVFKAAMNVKDDARSRVSDHPSWRRLSASLNFDIRGLSAEIGYDDAGQGELAGIAEFGSARHAPHPALIPAAEAEAPRFESALAKVVAG